MYIQIYIYTTSSLPIGGRVREWPIFDLFERKFVKIIVVEIGDGTRRISGEEVKFGLIRMEE